MHRLHAGLFALGSFLLVAAPVRAQELLVAPFVQRVTPTSAWIVWETSTGDESRVEWGRSAAFGEETLGTVHPSEGDARIHEVELTGLSPGARYHYRAHTGSVASRAFHFTTAPARDAEVSFRMIAMSDMQSDSAHPDVYRDLVHDGILAYSAREFAPLADDAISMVLVPGDLVDDGREIARWRDEFFAPGADLMSFVPFYPVLGNHEENSELYYRYFHLPEDGNAESPERWWKLDHTNVRLIGLDSNMFVLGGAQDAFLETALEEACADEHVDFVFVLLHHAHLSELWRSGQAPFATQVAARMDRFATECGRPSAQLYGHTHGYSRGQSRDHSHLWINVASAGGNLDHWGEYDDQRDVDEVSVSQDEYGFVLLEVEAGADPSFRLRRISRGDEDEARDDEVRDEIVIRRFDDPPATPLARLPRGRVPSTCNTLSASELDDPDGDLHGATHWQVSTSCDDFGAPVMERHRQHENWYDDVDTQAGDDLTDEPLVGLSVGTYYCWRVRYRDRGLAWSAWSEPVAFQWDDASASSGCDDDERLVPPPPDAGVEPGPASPGCGCRTASSARGSLGALWCSVLAWLALRRTARRG